MSVTNEASTIRFTLLNFCAWTICAASLRILKNLWKGCVKRLPDALLRSAAHARIPVQYGACLARRVPSGSQITEERNQEQPRNIVSWPDTSIYADE